MTGEKRDFDKEAASWDQRPYRIKLVKDIAHAIATHIALTPGMDVLDFGCGTGLLTLQLQPFVHSITGVDSSQGMLDALRAKILEQNLTNVRAVLFDIDKGDTLAGWYHLIVSSMTLHHVPEIEPLFGQFRHVLAPSGYLCLADVDLEDGQFHQDNTGVFHYGFDRAALRSTFIEAGFFDIRDVTATELTRPIANGEMRTFTIFLMMGRKK